MAKDDKGRVRMTVIHFDTESDNATLQENIRAIAQTLTRALTAQPRPAASPSQSLGPAPSANGWETGETHDDVEDSDFIDAEPTKPAKGKKPNSARRPTTPHTVEIDFKSAKTTLQSFLDQRKPTSIQKKYLAIAYWLRENLKVDSVTMHHIYTCFRMMGWNVPKDASQPLRDLKSQGWMEKASEAGAYTVNHVGENEVNKMGN